MSLESSIQASISSQLEGSPRSLLCMPSPAHTVFMFQAFIPPTCYMSGLWLKFQYSLSKSRGILSPLDCFSLLSFVLVVDGFGNFAFPPPFPFPQNSPPPLLPKYSPSPLFHRKPYIGLLCSLNFRSYIWQTGDIEENFYFIEFLLTRTQHALLGTIILEVNKKFRPHCTDS